MMSAKLATWTALSIATGLAIYSATKNIRIIQLSQVRERLLWTYRSWQLDYPVPLDLEKWTLSDLADTELYRKEAFYILRAWKFLGPFFASRGYTLYRADPICHFSLYPDPHGPSRAQTSEHPYARSLYTDDEEAEFYFMSLRVWPARDSLGRDVVIKLVSGPTPSDELKICHRLNTEVARRDPRNRTIHILDYVTFDGLCFVVMPRWDPAFNPDIRTVSEMMHLGEEILEGLDFLHENRIAHCDILEQNIGINVISAEQSDYRTGVCGPDSHYVLFDFGFSSIFPLDVDLDSVPPRDNLIFEDRYLPDPGPCNPFRADVIFTGNLLERYVRCAENTVPGVGPLLEMMIKGPPLTARQALCSFRKLKSTLSHDELAQDIPGRFWEDGRIMPRKPPVQSI